MTGMAPTTTAETAEKIRARLCDKRGRAFWRSLDELAETAEFRRFLESEFPALASPPIGIDRRSLLKCMSVALAFAGLTACTGEPDEEALPYVNEPESVVPGRPKWYATAVTLNGFALPALGKTHVGRPTKLEGNPDHPATHGATDPFLQASLLTLYDPDRSQSPRHFGHPASWSAFEAEIVARASETARREGEGFRLLTGAITSPTLLRRIGSLLEQWPNARWHVHEPVNGDLAYEATSRVFGRPLDRHLMLEGAEIVVSLDDDFFGPGPRQAIHARRWAARRQAFQKGEGDCRLFVAEATPSLTGAMADERLVTATLRIEAVGHAVAARLGLKSASAPELSASERHWVERAVAAIRSHPGRALVTVGPQCPSELQALGLLVNEHIGAFSATLRFTEPIAAMPPDGTRSFEKLTQDMAAGRVATLAVIESNPVYTSPSDVDFRAAMENVPLRIHAGLHYDETAILSHWHVPLAHELESWGDARAVDGTASVLQPLIRPFRDVRPLLALVDNLTGVLTSSDRETVRQTWRTDWGENFEARWRETLLRGFVAESAPPFVTPEVRDRGIATPRHFEGLTVVFRPDPTIWDGRFGDNPWLQETPKPFTKATWGNVVLVSPALAEAHGIGNGDELRIEANGRAITGPAWVMPGQETNTLTLTFGYGRSRTGSLGDGLGYDAYRLRPGDSSWLIAGATVTPTGEHLNVASTQLHQAMDGFDFIRTVDFADLEPRTAPADQSPAGQDARAPTFYPVRQWDSPSWGMSIDVDLCIGCNACVVACVAENNIAMVGKDQVAEGREMHWLRVDHYYEGDPAAPKFYSQPVPCMHCEQAPCEMGCPVNAAVHSFDGLNLQVYNRCIGTRTCSSYCPYKVRRFNWFDLTGGDAEELRAARNPDVTVRGRGVMEKCTYCVQRISEARIAAKIEGRPIQDGEIRTACQQACPTQAITFGDVTDAQSAVSRKKASPRNYTLLEEANTWPRTSYLARIERSGPDDEDGPG